MANSCTARRVDCTQHSTALDDDDESTTGQHEKHDNRTDRTGWAEFGNKPTPRVIRVRLRLRGDPCIIAFPFLVLFFFFFFVEFTLRIDGGFF